jgi:hypothetical protein
MLAGERVPARLLHLLVLAYRPRRIQRFGFGSWMEPGPHMSNFLTYRS